MIEYHPNSGKPPLILKFDARNVVKEPVEQAAEIAAQEEPADREPYRPFTTRLDFEFAELMLETQMNDAQKSTLIKLIHQVQSKPADFTLQSVGHLEKTWEYARTFRGVEVCSCLIFHLM